MTIYQKVITSGAISKTTIATVGSYTLPPKKGGTLVGVLVMYTGTPETAVSQGGKVELTNTAENWTPFELELPIKEAVVLTEGGVMYGDTGIFYTVKKKLPGSSKVEVKATLNDDQETEVRVCLIWEK